MEINNGINTLILLSGALEKINSMEELNDVDKVLCEEEWAKSIANVCEWDSNVVWNLLTP